MVSGLELRDSGFNVALPGEIRLAFELLPMLGIPRTRSIEIVHRCPLGSLV